MTKRKFVKKDDPKHKDAMEKSEKSEKHEKKNRSAKEIRGAMYGSKE